MTESLFATSLSAADARLIDQICDSFEAEWKAGRRPPLMTFCLSAIEPVRSALLRQLFLLDLEYRGHAVEIPRADDCRGQIRMNPS